MPPPTGVQTYGGDGAVSLVWTPQPGVEYWVFHAQDPSLSTTGNWTNLLAAGVIENAATPTILCGLINNPSPPSYFPPTFFSINARTGTAAGGPGSALVSANPRPAGGPEAPWVPGTTIPASFTAITYGAITPCGYAGRPASGRFVAVGPAGTIYFSSISPNIAGPLSEAQGNVTMSWAQASVPNGFSEDLLGVAAIVTGYANPYSPGLIFVAVGKGGTVLRSFDGQTWQQIFGIPTTNNLNAVASSGGTFLAVGDAGVVLASNDGGLTWNSISSATAVSVNTLNAIRCAVSSASCVAVGTNGTSLWTGNSGATWSLIPVGVNNWTKIAYGYNNSNADSIISAPGGVLTVGNRAINTWVVADAAGNYAYANASTGYWNVGTTAFSNSIAGIDYTTRFVAIDGSGNAYSSETGLPGTWHSGGSTGVSNPAALVSNGMGFVLIGATGANASSF